MSVIIDKRTAVRLVSLLMGGRLGWSSVEIFLFRWWHVQGRRRRFFVDGVWSGGIGSFVMANCRGWESTMLVNGGQAALSISSGQDVGWAALEKSTVA